MRIFIISCLYFAFATSILSENNHQRRAFWVVRHALNDEKSVNAIISHAAQYKITDIFVQVRALGRVHFPSRIERSVTGITPDFDPLRMIIQKANIFKIKVHAWVNMFYTWSGVKNPPEKTHPFHRFSDALLGNDSIPDYQALRRAGAEGYFLDPQNFEVQNYLLNLLTEIADIYNVSGIHLDYFRYPDVSISFTPANRTTFRLKYFFDPLEVYRMPELYAQKYGYKVYRHADQLYRSELSQSLSGYLERIALHLKSNRPELELSIAVKPDPVEAKLRYFQNWPDWLSKGFADFVVIMNYRTDYREFSNILLQLVEMNFQQQVLVGISTYNQSEQSVNNRLRALDKYRFAGFSLFSYNHLVENQQYLKGLNLLQ